MASDVLRDQEFVTVAEKNLQHMIFGLIISKMRFYVYAILVMGATSETLDPLE
jgi:hypothetical protein